MFIKDEFIPVLETALKESGVIEKDFKIFAKQLYALSPSLQKYINDIKTNAKGDEALAKKNKKLSIHNQKLNTIIEQKIDDIQTVLIAKINEVTKIEQFLDIAYELPNQFNKLIEKENNV